MPGGVIPLHVHSFIGSRPRTIRVYREPGLSVHAARISRPVKYRSRKIERMAIVHGHALIVIGLCLLCISSPAAGPRAILLCWRTCLAMHNDSLPGALDTRILCTAVDIRSLSTVQGHRCHSLAPLKSAVDGEFVRVVLIA